MSWLMMVSGSTDWDMGETKRRVGSIYDKVSSNYDPLM